MTEAPLGIGERPHGGSGNSTLITRDIDGRKVSTSLWVDDVRTDLSLAIDQGQVKGGMVHRPIRMQARFLSFNCLFPLQREGDYFELLRRIREHWAGDINTVQATPMEFHYPGANRHWLGFVGEQSVRRAWNDIVLTAPLAMLVVNSGLPAPNALVAGKAPYVPQRGDVTNWGDAWYSLSELLQFGKTDKLPTPRPGKVSFF